MTWNAYGDESEPDPFRYVLAGAMLQDSAEDEARDALAELRLDRQRKLRWHDESPARRRKIAGVVAGLESLHVVVVRTTPVKEPAERHRAKCLERLLYELDAADVSSVCLEARERSQNQLDTDLLGRMRATRTVGSRLRMSHAPGPAEPLLWLADIVAGAVTSALRGDPQHLDALGPNVDILAIDG
jgi:hypothetical protein